MAASKKLIVRNIGSVTGVSELITLLHTIAMKIATKQ